MKKYIAIANCLDSNKRSTFKVISSYEPNIIAAIIRPTNSIVDIIDENTKCVYGDKGIDPKASLQLSPEHFFFLTDKTVVRNVMKRTDLSESKFISV